jgi:hypothetical protein
VMQRRSSERSASRCSSLSDCNTGGD